jgi:hypothetical protein
MKERAILFLTGAAGLALAACQDSERAEAPANPVAEEAADIPAPPPEAPLATRALPAAPAPGTGLPPANAEPRFAGSWAAHAGMCEDKAWHFTDTGLKTPAGSVCHFSRVTKVEGGYDIAARCTAEGPEQDDLIKIRFAESAEAMLFESTTIADTGLIYCGPPD